MGTATVTGNLIVQGTTTTVNSTTVSVADPVFTLGGTSAVVNGQVTNSTTVVIAALNESITVGSQVNGVGIPNGTTVSAVDGITLTLSRSVSLADNVVLVFASTASNSKDKGIEFIYHTGNNATDQGKIGFFGYDSSVGAFTIIPESANDDGDTFSGSVGNAIFNQVTGTLQTAAQTNTLQV